MIPISTYFSYESHIHAIAEIERVLLHDCKTSTSKLSAIFSEYPTVDLNKRLY